MKYLAVICVLALAVGVASAAPVLTWEKEVVGAYDVYTMGVLGDQGANAWYLDAVFTATGGEFNQEEVDYTSFTQHVDTLSMATAMDGVLGYVKATDTWYYDDHWTECAPTELDVQGTTQIDIRSLGSKTNDVFESNPMVQFAVTPGTEICWVGRLSYAGSGVDVEGCIPEPMTMTLLAIGGLALIRRRKA